MAISAANNKLAAFLTELYLECLHAEEVIRQIRHGARHWRLLSRGKDFDRKFPPRAIMLWASACLGTFNRIRQVLVPGNRKGLVPTRCATLNRVIGPVSIDNICSPAVRHSWEHMDERLDIVFEAGNYKTYAHMDVAVRQSDPDHLSLRRLDPVTLTLSYGGETIHLRACLAEIRALRDAVDTAFRGLNDGRVVPWAPN